MASPMLLKFMQQTYLKKASTNNRYQANSGFTLVEVLVVVIMVGALAAIASPGWVAFVNRQRVNKANDAVLGALQKAQRTAQNKKLQYSVSFKSFNGTPKVAIYPGAYQPLPDNSPLWQVLGGEVGVKAGEILVGSNFNAMNNGGAAPVTFPLQGTPTVTFDYNGSLPRETQPNPPLKLVIAVPAAGNPTTASGIKRCVIVQTILGGIRTGRGESECMN